MNEQKLPAPYQEELNQLIEEIKEQIPKQETKEQNQKQDIKVNTKIIEILVDAFAFLNSLKAAIEIRGLDPSLVISFLSTAATMRILVKVNEKNDNNALNQLLRLINKLPDNINPFYYSSKLMNKLKFREETKPKPKVIQRARNSLPVLESNLYVDFDTGEIPNKIVILRQKKKKKPIHYINKRNLL